MIRGSKGSSAKAHSPTEAANTLQSKATYRAVHLVSAGPVGGLIDGERSVFFDDVPLVSESGARNFNGVTYSERKGTPDQEYIPGFPAVESMSAAFHAQVKASLAPVQKVATTNPAVNAILVTLQTPGLYRQEDDGDLVGDSIVYRIEWKTTLDPEWRVLGGGDLTLGPDKTMSTYEWAHRIELPVADVAPGDPYQVTVRVTRVSPDNETTTRANDLYWHAYTEIIDQRVRYADSAVIGMTMDSALFGDALPSTISFEVAGILCQVPTGYDHETRSYPDFWDGTFAETRVPTDNPAWIYYYLVTDPDNGLGRRGEEPGVDKWALYRIARFCDELVPDGQGGTEPRFRFAGVFNTRQSAYETLNSLMSVLHGLLFQGEAGLVPSADMPGDPDVLINQTDVVDGRISYSEPGLRTRHSVAIVSWNDPNDGWKLAQEVVEDPELIAQIGWVPLEIAPPGCAWQSQARRYGAWALDTERHEAEVATYQSTLAKFKSVPGKVAALADPRRMGVRRGGRLAAATASAVTLDAPVTLASGETYELAVTTPAMTLARRAVTSPPGEHAVLALDAPLAADEIPLAGADWILYGSDAEPRQYRIVSVAETEPTIFTVTAVRRDPTKWARIEQGLHVLEPSYTTIPKGDLAPPASVRLTEFQVPTGAAFAPGLAISWERSPDVRAVGYRVELRRPFQPWEAVAEQTGDLSVALRAGISPGGPYDARVAAIDGLGGLVSAFAYAASLWVTGKRSAPSNVAALHAEITRAGVRLSWTPIGDVDVAAYELRQGADWLSAPTVFRGLADSCTLPLTAPGAYVLQLKAFDGHGNESLTPASATVTVAAPGAPTVAASLVKSVARLAVTPAPGSYPVESTTITAAGQSWSVTSGALDVPVDWTGPRDFVAVSRDIHGNLGPARTVTVTIAAVSAPTAITTAGTYRGIVVTVAIALSPQLAGVQIWASETNNRADALQVGVAASGQWTISGLPLVAQRWIWARGVDIYGQTTAWYPADPRAGVRGETSTDASLITDLLDQALTEDMLATDLSERLAALDTLPLGFGRGVFAPGVVAPLPRQVIRHGLELQKQTDDLLGLIAISGEQAASIRALDAQLAMLSTSDWDATRSYAVDQVARSGGRIWTCISPVGPSTVAPEDDPAHWRETASLITLYGQVRQEVDELALVIADQVSKIAFDALRNRVQVAESTIAQQADEIELRVEHSTFDNFTTRLWPAYDPGAMYSKGQYVDSGVQTFVALQEINFLPAPPLTDTRYWAVVPDFSRQLTTALAGVDILRGEVDIHASAIVGPIALAEGVVQDGVVVRRVSDIKGLNVRLSRASVRVDGLAGVIELQASQIDGLTGRAKSAEVRLDGAEGAIALRATREDLDEVGGRLSQAEVALSTLGETAESLGARITSTVTILDRAVIGAPALAPEVAKDGVVARTASDVSGLAPRLSRTQASLAQAYQDISVLRDADGTLKAQLTSMAALQDEQGRTLNQASLQIAALQREDGELLSQITAIAAVNNAQGESIAQASEQITALQTADGDLRADIEAVAAVNDGQGRALAQASEQIGALQGFDQYINAYVRDMTGVQNSHGERLTGAELGLFSLQTETGTLASQYSALANVANQQGQTIASASERLTAMSDSVAGLLAQAVLEINVNGVCTGYRATSDGVSTAFKIQTDHLVVSNSTGDISTMPFVLGQLPGGGYGMVLRGDILASGSVAAEALAVAFLSAISASLGDIESGRIKAGDLEVVEGGRVVVGLDNVILDSNGNRLLVCPDGGEAAGNDLVRLDAAGLQVSYWDALYGTRRDYKPVTRSEQGAANSGDTVYLPGVWREQPRVQVSMNTLLGYDPAYAHQSQTWNVRAENLREYNPTTGGDQAGTGYWKFQAIARLELGGANGTNAVNSSASGSSDAWTSAEFETPENCSSITATVNLSSVRGTGTAPNYNYRRVSWRVGYASTPGGSLNWTVWRAKDVGATLGQVSDSLTVNFGSGGKWYCQVEFTASDAGGAFQSGSGGYEYGADVVVTNSGRQSVGGISYPSSVTLTLPTPSIPGGYELYAVDYSYNYSFSIPDGSGLKITHTYGTLYKSSSGNSYGLGSEVALSASGTDSSFTASKIKMTITSPNGTVSYVGAIWNARAACKIRKQIANSAEAQNSFTVSSYTYVLATATVLATGTCNYAATGR